MKYMLFIVLTILCLLSCQQQGKIGYVDNSKIVNGYYKKVDFEKSFQLKIDRFNKKADSLQSAIQLEAQSWQSRASSMSQAKAEEAYQALVQKKQRQDFELNQEEQLLQQEGQRKLDTLVKEVKQFIKNYGQTHGYTFILGANEAGSVLYGEASKDITNEVLEQLNKAEQTETTKD